MSGRVAIGNNLHKLFLLRKNTEQLAHERFLHVQPILSFIEHERLRRIGPITEPERLTTDVRWGFHPTVSPDGRSLVYVGADGRSDIQLRLDDPAGGSARHLTRTNGLSTFSWMPDGRLLVAQLELDGPYRSYGDLYVTSRRGRQQRLTYHARLTDPSVAHDGRSAVAVQQGDGTNGLVRVGLDTGVVTSLVAPDPDVHWAFPAVSPDGRWIAATRWEPNAYTDVVILDAASGERLHRVTRDRAVDLAPSWSPDSRWLVWSSDRTGIANILGAEVDPVTGHTAAPVMLTFATEHPDYPLEAIRNVDLLAVAMVEADDPEGAREALARLHRQMEPVVAEGGRVAEQVTSALGGLRVTLRLSGY